jgi:Zn-dependent peptidase ImmA (M78 family)/DNA-binding XRE family transcriptional regulator
MPEEINGNRLRMARIIHGLSSPKLASIIGVTKQAVWQYENNDHANPSSDVMFKICNELDFPRQFFYEGYDDEYVIGKSYCRTSTSTAKAIKEKQQYYNVLRGYLYRYFLQYIEFPSKGFPVFTLSEFKNDMEAYTLAVRKFYKINNKPIDSMVNFLENVGIILSTYNHEKDKFDGMSNAPMINGKKYRMTVYNLSNTTFARIQFTLCHELGHWLLGHIDSDEETLTNEDYSDNEKEAHAFAACLLLPKNEFVKDLRNPSDLLQYIPLKRKWKVSIATMIMRAKNLDLISYQQYQSLFRQLSKKGWRVSEPYDDFDVIPKPTLLPEAVDLLDSNNLVRKSNLVKEFSNHCFTAQQSLYEHLLGLTPHSLDVPPFDTPKLQIIR